MLDNIEPALAAFAIVTGGLLYLVFGYAVIVGFGDWKGPLAKEPPLAIAVAILLWPLGLVSAACEPFEKDED